MPDAPEPYGGDIAKAAQQVGIPTGVSQLLDTIGNLAGIAANVFGAFQAGVAVLQLFGVGAPDPNQQYFLQIENQLSQIQNQIGQLQQQLDSVFSTLEGDILGAANENVRIQCSNALADSRTAASEVLTYVQNSQDPQQMSGFDDALSRSLSAVEKLAPEGLWIQVNSARSFYGDAYNGTLYPPDANASVRTVFDYRFALPAYIEAVLNRIIVLSAADSSYRDQAKSEVKQYADSLVAIHDKIMAGFTYLRLPTLAELTAVVNAVTTNTYTMGSSWWAQTASNPGWLQNGRLYGAVDTVTGNAVQLPFSQFEIFGLFCATRVNIAANPSLSRFNLQVEMQHLLHKVTLASRGLGVQLYQSSGMAQVWSTATTLYSMIGLPAPVRNAAFNGFIALSFAEALALFAQPQEPILSGLLQQVSMQWVTLVDASHVSVRPTPPVISLAGLFAPPTPFQPSPAGSLYPGSEPT